MHFDASFFVAIGFILFVLLLGYLGVHTLIGKTLDDRGAAVAAELNEAKRLREEAEALLTSYKAKAAEAEKEAADIVASAKEEAEAMAQEAAKRSEEFVARRTRQAEEKIARAEAQAIAEVQGQVADLAIETARTIISQRMDQGAQSALVEKAISELRGKLH